MRIGIFLPQFEPESGGGYTFPTTILDELYNIRTDHDFFVFYYGSRMQEIGHVKFVPLSLFQPTLFKKAMQFFRKVVNKSSITKIKGPLNRAAKQYQIDLMWFITPTYEPVDVPFVFTVWDLQHRLQPFFPEVSKVGWDWDSRERHYRDILPRATFVLTGTEAGKEELVRFYGVADDRIRLLLHPTPDFALRLKGSSKTTSKLKLPKRFIFYPAQFWPHKNHLTLLKALQLLNDKKKLDIHLYLSGSDKGNMKYIKQAAAAMGLADKVHFLGFVSEEDLVHLYKNALALTYVTLFGPENLPPLEAFALGCPVVASRVSGSDEQLGSAAYLVKPTDPAAIAEAVAELAGNNKLRQQLIARGFKRAANWTSGHYVRGILQLIEDFEPYRRCWP